MPSERVYTCGVIDYTAELSSALCTHVHECAQPTFPNAGSAGFDLVHACRPLVKTKLAARSKVQNVMRV